MFHRMRFERDGQPGFGTLKGDVIGVHLGDVFDAHKATGQHLPLASASVLAPSRPFKVIAT